MTTTIMHAKKAIEKLKQKSRLKCLKTALIRDKNVIKEEKK